MDYFGIAQLSMDMSAAKVQQSAQLSMMKKSMDTQEASMDLLLGALPEQPVSFGQILDVRV